MISVTLVLTLALIESITAQTSDEVQTFFSKDYPGISIKFNATRETIPGENITINMWINCTATGVKVNYLTFYICGFRYGQEKITLNFTSVIENVPLDFNYTSQFNYTVPVPNDVWDATYAELHLEYAIIDSPFTYNPAFSITIIRNVYMKELEDKLKSLNYTYWQLNQTFWESFQMNLTAENLALLNKTYWELQGGQSELGNTRIMVGVLAVTTVFFVATTLYVVMRKPKQYW